MAAPRGSSFGGGGGGDPLAALRDGDPGPLYWFSGKERFLVDRAVTLVKERALDPRTKDFNYDLLYAKEAGPQKILAAARTLPMMARRRLVIVRDADALDAKELEQLVAYVEKPSPETCLLFVAEKADLRLKFFTTFKKQGVLLKLEPLAERQLPAFVREEARSRGLRVQPDAASLLVAEVGSELGLLVDAIERLALYAGASEGKREVRIEDVEAVVASTRTRSVFELSDAIGEGNLGRALGALGSLLKAREPALRILAMVARQVRLLLTARSLLDARASRGELAEALGLPPFVVEKIEAQARRFDARALVAMHRVVFETDQRLKSSKVDDERLMEKLVLDLVALGGRRPSGDRTGAAARR